MNHERSPIGGEKEERDLLSLSWRWIATGKCNLLIS